MGHKTESTYPLHRPLDVKHYPWKENSMQTLGYKRAFEPIAWKRPATIRVRKSAESLASGPLPLPYNRLSYQSVSVHITRHICDEHTRV